MSNNKKKPVKVSDDEEDHQDIPARKKTVRKQASRTKVMTEEDGMQSLMSMTAFDKPVRKKDSVKLPRRAEFAVDFEKDSQEEINKKLVLAIEALRNELEEYRIYGEGTYCTQAVHNRFADETDKRLSELTIT
jgi:hypothetical protein